MTGIAVSLFSVKVLSLRVPPAIFCVACDVWWVSVRYAVSSRVTSKRVKDVSK